LQYKTNITRSRKTCTSIYFFTCLLSEKSGLLSQKICWTYDTSIRINNLLINNQEKQDHSEKCTVIYCLYRISTMILPVTRIEQQLAKLLVYRQTMVKKLLSQYMIQDHNYIVICFHKRFNIQKTTKMEGVGKL